MPRSPIFTVPGLRSALCLLLALALTSALYFGLNTVLLAWLDARLERGVSLWKREGRIPDGAKRVLEGGAGPLPDEAKEAKFRLLHAIQPDLFPSHEIFDGNPRTHGSALTHHLLELRVLIASGVGPGQSEPLSLVLDRTALNEIFDRLDGVGGGRWDERADGHVLDYLDRVTVLPKRQELGGTARGMSREAFVATRLAGCRPATLQSGAVALTGLCEPVQPAPLEGHLDDAEGHLYEVDRRTPPGTAEESRLRELDTVLEGLFERLGREAALPQRLLQAGNGPIQWLTVAAAFWCLLLLLDRYRTTRAGLSEIRSGRAGRLRHDFLTEAARLRAEGYPPAAARAEVVAGYERARDGDGHGLAGWLITVVPMLGFIGTLVGMMMAMGNAGLVVAAQGTAELRRAMDTLSIYLGTAFDTTLVALLLSMLLERLRGVVVRRDGHLLEVLRTWSAAVESEGERAEEAA
jgi:hypothetical protein